MLDGPVYDVDGIQIWHADCAYVLPLIDPDEVGLLLTDPPYGIGMNTRPIATGRGIAKASKLWQRYGGWDKDYDAVINDHEGFDPTPLLAYRNLILFGGNYFADKLPPSSCWIVWDKKRQGTVSPGWNSADAELAWTSFTGGVKVFAHLWAGYKRDSELGQHVHPTQKPVALMRWIVDKWTEPGDLVLDPYMGSGPVARACADLGRRYIGVEIVEEYVDAAIGRLGQTAMVFD